VKKRKSLNKPDPLFDGHIEKPLSKMTPREKLHYIWLQMEFKYKIRNRKTVKNGSKKTEKRNVKSSDS
jgi:hypothetical protein